MGINFHLESSTLLQLNSYLESAKSKWDSAHPDRRFFSKSYLIDCTIFLLQVVDDLIPLVQERIKEGKEKKVVVMSISSDIFTHIVESSFPLWLRPFAPIIKEVIVNIIISNLIEFIVKKYKEGVWKSEEVVNPPDAKQSSIIYCSKGGF